MEEAQKVSKDFEIIVANDGSKDKTEEILNNLAKEDSRIKVFSYYPNRGMGYALRNLYKMAKGNFVIHCDADLSFHPSIFPRLLEETKNADVVVSSKYVGIEGKVPTARILASRAFNLIYPILLGIKVKDLGSGCVLFKKKVLDSINLKSNRFELHAELFAKIYKKGFTVKEIPVPYVHRQDSRFSVLKDGPKTLTGAFRIWWDMLWEK